MTLKISVDPEVLEASAEKLYEHCSAYENTYNQLCQCINAIQAERHGKDYLAYVNQLRGYELEFVSLSYLMRNYAEFLRITAKAYRSTIHSQIANTQILTRKED